MRKYKVFCDGKQVTFEEKSLTDNSFNGLFPSFGSDESGKVEGYYVGGKMVVTGYINNKLHIITPENANSVKKNIESKINLNLEEIN